MSPLQSAVIVAVPEAENAVSSWRDRLDPVAGWGVPAHTELIPHLTIGDNGPLPEMAAAEQSVQALLPIHARVSHARLICGSTELNFWRTVRELSLGPPGD